MHPLLFWFQWLPKLQLSELRLWLSQSHSLEQPHPGELQPVSEHSSPSACACRGAPASPTDLPRRTPCLFCTSGRPILPSTVAAPGLSLKSRCLPALALVLPTFLSLYLAITHTKVYGSFSFVKFVQESRTSVQILVQILTGVLSIAQVYCLCQIINFFMRLKIERVTLTLRELSLWSAMSNAPIDWNLPPKYLLLTIVLVGPISFVPGALWAGALTPVVTVCHNLTSSLDVASYSTRSANLWNSEFLLDKRKDVWNWISNCTTDPRGLIPSCPVPNLQALLLVSASTATTVDGRLRLHAKLDNPMWTYIGRSYGVGSSVGLTLPSFGLNDGTNLITEIHYLESGYDAQVKCIRNSSSDIMVEDSGFGSYDINYYTLRGRLPNEPAVLKAEFYPIPAYNTSYQKIVAWAARSWEGRYTLAIATGNGSSSILNRIQCEVIFIPAQFQVSVNLISNTITATIVSSPAKDIEASGNLKSNVIESLNLLSRMSPSLYQSVVGNALMMNVQNLRYRHNMTNINDNMTTRAVADSFTAMIDDILVAYGASQLVIAKDLTPVKAFGNAYGVQVGNLGYICATLVLNIGIIALWLEESVRTCFWSSLSKFNYVELTSMVLAASAGGTGVASAFQHWHTCNGLGDWDGDSDHPTFDAIKIQVRHRHIVLATADSATEVSHPG